jgi:hypothetical protein
MSLHPLFAGILASSGMPQATDSRTALLRDLADFVEHAGNVLCDDCHDHLSNQAGMLLKRIQRELGE